MKQPKWSEQEIQILTEYYSQKRIDEVVELLPTRSRSAVCKMASNLKLTNFTKNQRDSQKIYQLNQDFFDEPNIQNSYWAGFIASDGYLGKDNSIIISLSHRDEIVINNFKKHIDYDGPIKYYYVENRKYAKISVWGACKWHDMLYKHWNIPLKNKTKNLKAPLSLNHDNTMAYIIGLIDGDGWIYRKKNGLLAMGFCGTKEVVEFVKNVFSKYIDSEMKIRLNGNCKFNYVFRIDRQKDILKIIEIVNKIDVPWKLKRKWNHVQ